MFTLQFPEVGIQEQFADCKLQVWAIMSRYPTILALEGDVNDATLVVQASQSWLQPPIEKIPMVLCRESVIA